MSRIITLHATMMGIISMYFLCFSLQGSGGRGVLPEDIRFRLSTAPAGLQTGRQVRSGRDDIAVQAQLPALHYGLRPSDTVETPGRLRLFQTTRLQQHRFDLHVETGLRLQATYDRVVESAVRRCSRLPRLIRRDDLQLLSRGIPTLYHFQDVYPCQVSM